MGLISAGVSAIVQRVQTERLPTSSGRTVSALGAGSTGNTDLAAYTAYASSGWLFQITNRIANSVARVDWEEYLPAPTASTKTANLLAELTLSPAQRVFHPEIAAKKRRVAASYFSHDRIRALAAEGELIPAPDISPVGELWANPNPFYSEHEVLEVLEQHLELTGEGWLLVVRGEGGGGMPTELWPIRPDRIQPVPDREKFIAGYVYTNGSERIPLEPEDVIFLRVPSPTDPYRGQGWVQSVLYDLDSDRFAAQWNRNFFTNGAEPGGVIESPTGLSDAEFARLRDQWREEHQGVNQAHRVAILEKSHFIPRVYSHVDMAFVDGRKWNRDIFLGAAGMPGHMLGISETVNRANAEAGEVMFARWLVIPRLDRIKMALNGRLVPMFPGVNRILDYVDPTPEDKLMHLMAGTRSYQSGLAKKDEGRAMIGLPPADDGTGEDYIPTPAAGGFGGSVPGGNTDITGDESGAPVRALKAAPSDWPEALQAADEEMRKRWAERLGDVADDVVRAAAEQLVDAAPHTLDLESVLAAAAREL